MEYRRVLILPSNFIPDIVSPEFPSQPPWWFVFAGHRLLVRMGHEKARPLEAGEWPLSDCNELRRHYLGTLDGRPCYAIEVDANLTLESSDLTFAELRGLAGLLDDSLLGVVGKALQIVDWDRTHQFCGRCGAPMEHHPQERSKVCPCCDLTNYPRLAPAIMVRIVRDGRILLARAPRFPKNMYSVLAGFVDAGETLEQALHREVAEEVGLTVKNLHYFASQSWPFPHSLMIAFSADYAAGEIRVDGEEIVAADWFTPDNLPQLPGEISIARRLIDDFLASYPQSPLPLGEG